MDRGWMYCSKTPDPKFVNGVYSFVKTARTYCINKLQADDHIYCHVLINYYNKLNGGG